MQVVTINVSMLEKGLGKKKRSKGARNHKSLTKKLYESSSKEKVQELPRFVLLLFQLYQTTCLSMYQIKGINASSISVCVTFDVQCIELCVSI